MTLLMRDDENQKIGANRLRKLLQLLASKGLTDERERAIDDFEILYRKGYPVKAKKRHKKIERENKGVSAIRLGRLFLCGHV